VTEDGGTPNVVTVADSLVIDGGGGSSGGLTINDSGSNGDVSLIETSGYAILEGASGLGFYRNGSAQFWADSSGVYPGSAGGSPLGNTSFPWDALTLGDATAQVELGHDGATDGKLVLSDPNSAAGASLVLTDAAGNEDVTLSESSGSAVVNGVGGGSLRYANVSRLVWGSGAVAIAGAVPLNPSSAGSSNLGEADKGWGSIYGAERSSNPTGPSEGHFVIWMSDGTGHGDDGDVMIASQAGGTTNYGTLFDHSGGTTF
jgi:hypothetical protein